MSSQVHALAEKMFRKYQQISANFSNCDEVYFQKRIIFKTGECIYFEKKLFLMKGAVLQHSYIM